MNLSSIIEQIPTNLLSYNSLIEKDFHSIQHARRRIKLSGSPFLFLNDWPFLFGLEFILLNAPEISVNGYVILGGLTLPPNAFWQLSQANMNGYKSGFVVKCRGWWAKEGCFRFRLSAFSLRQRHNSALDTNTICM